MNSGINIGDVIFQLFALGVPIFFIVILLLFWRSSKKKKEQLDRIEEKLNSMEKKN
ncbi:DUF4083 domain-containing protein (plasmid) [Peribacillus sp. JNUCC 23]|uniref:DUF4083 domain-containing protein n=1 Tax=Peribacillus loiseleuriae TaxID=1679170 RepID=UPI003D012CA5